MAKKLIIIIIALIIIGCGVYFGIFKFRGYNFKANIGGIKTLTITMPFESGLEDLELSNFDIGVSLPANLFSDIFIDTNLKGEMPELEKPYIPISTPSVPGRTSSSDLPINETICGQFKSAPSCGFVPEQYRGLCEQCKNFGY